MTRGRERDERGTITLWVLGLCISLMFLGGLSLDLWRAVAERRQLSSMADTRRDRGRERRRRRRRCAPARCVSIRCAPVRSRSRRSTRIRTRAALDAVDVEVVGNRVTVTLRDHVRFSLLGIFMGGEQFDIQVHAAAEPVERPVALRRRRGRLTPTSGTLDVRNRSPIIARLGSSNA